VFCFVVVSNSFAAPLICIDPGHGGSNIGAVKKFDGIELREQDINLDVAKFANYYLTRAGYKTVMTRNSDTDVSFAERAAIANRNGAGAFVSIHHNAADNSSCVGSP